MSHVDYISHLSAFIASAFFDNDFRKFLDSILKEFVSIVNLNLDQLSEKLKPFYCPKPRRKPIDPICIIRSLVLMTMLKESSITEWVSLSRTQSLYAVLSGFESGKTPGIGTYYDFFKRLINGPYQKPCQHTVRKSDYNSKKHLRSLKKEKEDKKTDLDPHNSQSQQLVDKLLNCPDSCRLDDFNKILEDMQLLAGVLPTVNDGILINLQNITASGDGSILATEASSQGQPSCTCRIEGIKKCEHPRYYTSPTAQWCYDHHHDRFVFGDRYYVITATCNGRDLPLITIMPGGNESDFTLSLKALDRLLEAVRENQINLTITIYCGDGHHDSYAHYQYLNEKNIIPVIPLSENSKKAFPHLLEDKEIKVDTDGVPLCPGSVKMRHHVYNKKKQTHVYTCPVKQPTRKDGKYCYITHLEDCPNKKDCLPESPIGPLVYIKSSTDPRFYPPIPRDSKQYKELANQRSAAERYNSVVDSYKIDYKCRNAAYGLIRLTLVNISIHAVARYNEAIKKYDSPDNYLKHTLKTMGVEYQDSS